MLQNPQLIQNSLPRIESDTWYRQRFDACPHFMFFLGDAHISDIQTSHYPYGQRITYAGFSKNRADWYHSLTELEHTAKQIIEAAARNPSLSRAMIDTFRPWQDTFYQLCTKLGALDFSNLTNNELVEKYKELAEVYTKKLNSSPLIDGFTLTTDTTIANELKDFLGTLSESGKFNEYFETLTAPTFLSFLQEEELALSAVAKQIQENPSQKEQLLLEHQKKYFWIQNNYVKDNILSVSEFAERLNNSDIHHSYRTAAIPEANKAKKLELIEKLNLPSRLQTLLTITDDFNAWQDERKKGTFWATHYFSLFLEEISRRTNYTLEELKYSFPTEIAELLIESIPRETLQQRYNYCIILWTPQSYDVTTDKALITRLDTIGTGHVAHTTTLTGFAAQLGIATGPARIVESVEEISKVQEGDVLVAVMTRPDYLPAMKKAIAFVTDEGGITCHAAIVAREMKKPCIVGTKVATKILKDGQQITVDANNGTVTIL